MAQLTQTTAQIQTIINTAISNPMTTSGDLIVGVTGSAPTRLPKGTAKQVLSVNSSANGLEWTTLGGGSSSTTTFIDLTPDSDPFDSSSSPSWSFTDQSTTAQAIISAIANGNEYVVLRFSYSSYGTMNYALPIYQYNSYSSGVGTDYQVNARLETTGNGTLELYIRDSSQSMTTEIGSYHISN